MVIEAKYMPANNVETESRERVGKRIRGQTHPIEAPIALRYPAEFAHIDNIDKALEETNDLEYCAVYPKGKRLPTTGWLKGSVCDLADLIHLVDVPRSAFDKAASDLRESIDSAVSVLENSNPVHLTDQIFSLLGLVDVLQIQRIANALI